MNGRWTAIIEAERAFTLLEELLVLVANLPQPDSLTFAEGALAMNKKAREAQAFFAQLESGPYPSAESQSVVNEQSKRSSDHEECS